MDKRINPVGLSIVLVNILFALLIVVTSAPDIIDAFRFGAHPFMVAAMYVATLCILTAIVLAVRAKTRTNRYPDELVELPLGDASTPSRNFALSAVLADALLVYALWPIPAAKPVLGLIIPGSSIVILFFWIIWLYPYVAATAEAGFWGGLRTGVFVFSTLTVATAMYAASHTVVAGTMSPYLAWGVAVLEASVLVPLLMWLGRQIHTWAQDYLTPPPQIISPGDE